MHLLTSGLEHRWKPGASSCHRASHPCFWCWETSVARSTACIWRLKEKCFRLCQQSLRDWTVYSKCFRFVMWSIPPTVGAFLFFLSITCIQWKVLGKSPKPSWNFAAFSTHNEICCRPGKPWTTAWTVVEISRVAFYVGRVSLQLQERLISLLNIMSVDSQLLLFSNSRACFLIYFSIYMLRDFREFQHSWR